MRRVGAKGGPSVGELAVAVAIQRACAPGPKRELGEFGCESAAPVVFAGIRVQRAGLSSRRAADSESQLEQAQVAAAKHEVVPPGTPLRPSLVDPYRAFIRETLEKFPTLTASRLYDMVCERGYAGQRQPLPPPGQHDATAPAGRGLPAFAHAAGRTNANRLGSLRPPADRPARRPLMGFVVVLSYSRRIFLRFFLDARMDSFLRGHVEAFSRVWRIGQDAAV